MRTDCRCFRRIRDDGDPKRCGVWVMTRPTGRRGVFFHGDKEDIQAPLYSVEELDRMATRGGFLPVEEITEEEALKELESCPGGQEEMRRVFARHQVKEET